MNNKFLYELEKKFGKFAIPNLPLMMILCYGVGYLIYYVNPAFLNYLTLEPAYILRGQVWRILTWIIMPPRMTNVFFILIMLFFYYSIGMQLERTWGVFYYNVYIFSGLIFTLIAAFISYGILYAIYHQPVSMGDFVSTYYVSMSIILAYSATFPDAQVLLMFLIPVKMKWMGIIYIAYVVIDMITANWVLRVMIIASLLNFFLFFLTNKTGVRLNRKQRSTRNNFKRHASMVQNEQRAYSSGAITRHKCAICGQNEKTAPNMAFRFCSKCNGNYEYCENHIFTHTHVK